MKKKLISLLLVLVLMLQLSGGALAAIGNYIGNTPAQNQEIYDQLAALTGGTSDEARALLNRLGLLDKDGNLDLTASITMDGKSMTVDQVRKLLAEPGTDLTKIVNVDGIPLTMGDLQTILNIEAELARIQATYFSGKTFGADATDNLNSLMSQIETQGISVHSEAPATPAPAPYLAFSVSRIELDDITKEKSFTITLNGTLTEDASFDISLVGITACEGTQMSFTATNGGGGNWGLGLGGTHEVTIPSGTSNWSGTVTVHAEAPEGPKLCLDVNDHMGYLQFSNAKGIGMTDKLQFGYTVPIAKECKSGHDVWNTITNTTQNMPLYIVGPSDAMAADNATVDASATKLVLPILPDSAAQTAANINTGDRINIVRAYLDDLDLYQRKVTLDIEADLWFSNLAYRTEGTTDFPTGILAFPENHAMNISGWVSFLPSKSATAPTIKLDGAPSGMPSITTWGVNIKENENNKVIGAQCYFSVAKPTTIESVRPSSQDIISTVHLSTKPPEANLTMDLDKADGTQSTLAIELPLDKEYTTLIKEGQVTQTDGRFGYDKLKDCQGYHVSANTTKVQNLFHGVMYSARIKINEKSIPTVIKVASASKPATYSTGQIVPIAVTFSEPVQCSGLSIVANGVTLSGCACARGYSGTTHVFHYPVKAADDTWLYVTKISGVRDPFENKMPENEESHTIADVTLRSCFMKDAVTEEVAAAKSQLEPAEAKNGTTLTLTLNQADGFKTKYPLYDTSKHKAPFVARLQGGDGTLIPFTLKETTGVISATAPTGALAFGTEQKTYTYDILAYEYDNAAKSWSKTPMPTGKSVDVKVNPMVFADVKEVTYIGENKTELSLTDPYVPKLGVAFKKPDPTFTSGKWTSSNVKVATIDATTGQVTLAGQELGKVKFTFTADDGALEGVTDSDKSHIKTGTSQEYNVTAGGEAGIVVPKGGDSIIALEKSKAQVRWYGNMKQYLKPAIEGTPYTVNYTVEVFEGNFAPDTDFTGKIPVHTATDLPIATTSYEIPADKLTKLSVGSVPAYTVRISTPHPDQSVADTIKLYAYAYIIVNPVPVTVRLKPPAERYVLDSGATSSVTWDIGNYKQDTTTAKLTVERVPEVGETVPVLTEAIATASGTKEFSLAEITAPGALRDLYVVTVSAKNTSDTVWNSDSYQFYVYKNGALDIVVGENKEKLPSATLSNRENTLVTTLPTTTDGIMELRGKLGLNTPIGINYGEYAWSALKDGIKWTSADDTKVRLNFKQGSFYEDIKRFNYDRYLPATTMAVSGVGETEKTVITATHANTGMATSIDVKVESLQNKLYLFQATPMLETTLTYTDGKGTEKTVKTNAQGTLALYEPDGIRGAVYLRATAEDDLYLGTISAEILRSGEGNTLVQELYPLNSITLRKVARTDLYLKKPDGTPYTGSVTLRGGVYKNGGYCQEAQFGINTKPLVDGTTPQIVTGAEGKLALQMDITQFWSKEKGEAADDGKLLKSTDKLEYIFELTDMSGSCPALVYVDGVSPVEISSRTGEGVVTLDKDPGKPGIFLANQRTFDKNGDTRSVRYRPDTIGPNEVSPKGTELVSTMLLWGEETLKTKDYSVHLLDEFGFQPKDQKSQTITYPFSTIPVVRNTMTLTVETLTQSGWVPEGQPRGVKLQVLKNGTLQQDIPTDIKVADLSKVPALKGETTTNIIADMKIGSGVGAPADMSHDNKVVQGLMKRLSGDDESESISGPVDTSSFKMIISPGDDSATFKAFIWAGYNSLGLEDAEYDDKGLSVTPHLLEDELSTGFGGGDAAALASGAQEAAQTGAELAKTGKSVSGGGSFGGQLEGYYECLIKFNFKTQQWEIFTLGGGFTVGFGGSFGKTVNQMVGPIPITASFELGAAIQLDFKMASRYKVMGEGLEWSDSYKDKQYVSDFLTTLRINAYFEAFGGIGFDISIVALKFGVFGRLGVDNSNAFLSRTYLKDTNLHQVNGQALKLTGEVGIEFVLTVIGIIDYKATLASIDMEWNKTFNDWNTIQNYWKNTGSGLGRSLGAMAAFGARNGLTLVDASASLQSRDYLEDFDRTWGAPRRMSRALDEANGLQSLQSNAYPNSRPYVTDDGKYLLYISDQDNSALTSTRICVTEKGGNGAYPKGAVIAAPTDFPGFGDSDLRLAGKNGLAVAAWVRQNTDHKLEAGQKVTANIQSVLTNATEIVASVNTAGTWASTRLTTNGSPDLAPVVAANDSKAIVAWRSVYAADAAKPMDFTAQDKVLYKIYDKTENKWSDAKTLYPGTSGVVKGIEAAMLPDGTAAVTYVLDRSGTGDASTYEVAATIVDAVNGNPGRTLMLTSDKYSDENPQIAAVNCGTLETPDPRFIIGWYSTKGEGGDIRMAALDKDGLPSATFPESLGQIARETMIGNNFRFVAADTLANLSILWSATSQDQTAKGDQLLGVKFLPENGKIGLSAPIDVATLPAHNNTDHFDAYVSDAENNQIKAVIQGTKYAPVDKSDPTTYEVYSVTDENEKGEPVEKEIYVPKGQTMLYTATESYKNKLTLTQVWADYANLAVNSLLPVQFTVQNSGFEQLTSVSIKLGESAPKDFTVNLAPNESATLTLYHAVGATVADVDYTITPTFASVPLAPIAGKLHLDYPDLGVAGLKVIAENEGQRDLRITLYNGGAAKLDKANRSINIAFYDNSLLEGDAVNVTYGVDPPTKKITITDSKQLALADNGALCADVRFNLDTYLTTKSLKENGEIPATGMRLYAKVWVEDSAIIGADKTLPEFHKGNNTASVQLDSLLHRAGEPVTITVAQSLTGDGKTKAEITVRNNSLKSVDGSGNVIATLLDQSGNVLETQQSYQPEGRAISNGLITLGAEESNPVNFTFHQAGASVKVTYGALVLDNPANAELTSLSATGIPIRLADFKVDPEDGTKFTANVSTAAGKTLITALTKDPGAAVTINGALMPPGGTPLTLSTGENKIIIVITARDGTTKRTYEILAERTTSDPSGVTSYVISATAGPGGTIAPKGISRVPRGGSKTYTITPDKGYAISDVLVDGVSAGRVSDYTFEKVKERHTIEARFAPTELTFTDVAETDWFYSAVKFVTQEELMNGVGDNRFAPQGSSSRAMVATVLYRMAGSPAVTGNSGFGDVPAGQWHSDAITWAAANGVAQGNGKGFAPGDDVTREQLAQLFYNYAKLKNYDLTPAGDLSKFTDAPTGWSREAMAWAVGSGIMGGKGNGVLDPAGDATRVELAAMLMRLQKLEK